jgi:hypothetical protein
MPINPFKPPRTNPLNTPGSPLRAVLVGLAIDLGGTALLGVVLQAIYVMQVGTPDMTESQLHDALQSIPPDSGVMIAAHLLGALLSVAAGFACARIVRRDEYRVGAVMAGASLLLGMMLYPDDQPVDMTLLLILCDIACNMLGVKYGAEYNRRREVPATPPADTPLP